MKSICISFRFLVSNIWLPILVAAIILLINFPGSGIGLIDTGVLIITPVSILISIIHFSVCRKINGIKWFISPTDSEGVSSHKNLPSAEQYRDLLNIGYTWDDKRKGLWVAGNHATNHKGSLFFPAEGIYHKPTKLYINKDVSGYYLTSDVNEEGDAMVMYFNKNRVCFLPRPRSEYEYSIREIA